MKEFVLLVVDDDDLVIQSVKRALPATWRMLATRCAEDVPARGYQAALEMVWRGKQEANGLTERTLTEFRRAEKAGNGRGRL